MGECRYKLYSISSSAGGRVLLDGVVNGMAGAASAAALPDQTAAQLTAFATFLIGLCSLFGVYTAAIWRHQDKNQSTVALSASWADKRYDDLYLSGRFDNIKNIVEYRYDEVLSKLISKRLSSSRYNISDEEISILNQLDGFLNIFENICHLTNAKQMLAADAHALDDYWLRLFDRDDRGELRQYIRDPRFSYDRLSQRLASLGPGVVEEGSLLLLEEPTSSVASENIISISNFRTLIGSLKVVSSYRSLPVRKFPHLEGKQPRAGVLVEILDPDMLGQIDVAFGVCLDIDATSPVSRRCRRIRSHVNRVTDYWYYEPSREKRLAGGSGNSAKRAA